MMEDGFAGIDRTLSEWGEINGVSWFREHQDTEVRTFFLSAALRSRVQVWVDLPKDGLTTVYVSQQPAAGRSRRLEAIPTSIAALAGALDRGLEIAGMWNSEAD